MKKPTEIMDDSVYHEEASEHRAIPGGYTETRKGSPVTIRLDREEDLEVTDIFNDGLSFISPRPVLGGRRIQVVLCNAIEIECLVVGCVRMPGQKNKYLVRLRFHNSTSTLNNMIRLEMKRLLGHGDA